MSLLRMCELGGSAGPVYTGSIRKTSRQIRTWICAMPSNALLSNSLAMDARASRRS